VINPEGHRPSDAVHTLSRPSIGVVAARVVVCTALGMFSLSFASPALAQDNQRFTTSNLQVKYGNFQEPGIDEDVPKNDFTFENTSAGRGWSSYLFVDVLRSWSEADANAKEVYGEWYPSLSLRTIAGRQPSTGVLRDVKLTVGLNTGVRSTGPSPFVVLPGVTVRLHRSRPLSGTAYRLHGGHLSDHAVVVLAVPRRRRAVEGRRLRGCHRRARQLRGDGLDAAEAGARSFRVLGKAWTRVRWRGLPVLAQQVWDRRPDGQDVPSRRGLGHVT